MNEMKIRIEETISSVDKTTELFYQNQIKSGYENLENTILILSKTIDEIYRYKNQGNMIEVNEEELNEALTQAVNAMEEKDPLLLSDILQYEINEGLKKIQASII